MQINESNLIEREICIRNLSLTGEVMETRRASVRWLALALGIINPGESRLGALAVFDSVLYFHFNNKSRSNVKQLSDYIAEKWGGINEKTLRYHLLQLKKMGIISHSKGEYSMTEPISGDRYDERAWVESYFEREVNPVKDKVSEMLKKIKQR